MTYTPQDLLNISAIVNKDIYESSSSIVIANISLVENSTVKNTLTGFKASLYYDSATQKYIVSFCGTNSPGDVISDVQMAGGNLPSQFKDAIKYMQNLKKDYDISLDQIELVTGHSLGGSLAQLVGQISDYSSLNVVTLNAYGTSELQSALQEYASDNESTITSGTNVKNYVVMNDEVGNFKTQVGDIFYLQPVPITSNPALDVHNSILLYSEAIYGSAISSNTLNLTNAEGLSLWYYDKNNTLADETASSIASLVSEAALVRAIGKINSIIGTPINVLQYYTGNGGYVIGNSSSNTLEGEKVEDPYGVGYGDDNFNDHIWGNGGNDVINGLGGNDTIYGGDGSDTVYGGEGNDVIYGYTNSGGAEKLDNGSTTGNYLYGDAGNDIIWGGGAGNDYLDGGAGNDTIHAVGSKSATIFGGADNDSIIGASGNDIINGGDGSDTIRGNSGNDSILGGIGSDEIHGGLGNDTIFGASVGVTGDGKNDLYGGDGIDYITGGDGNDYIDGGIGHDILDGGDGNDYINGGDGDDYITGGAGTDLLAGGSGDDTYYMNYQTAGVNGNFNGKSRTFKALTADTIVDSDGKGSIIAGGLTLTGGTSVKGSKTNFTDSYGFSYDLSGSVLTISNGDFSFKVDDFTNGNLGIHLKDSAGNDVSPIFTGGSSLIGTSGIDTLTGTEGNDIIYGQGGNDFIYAGAGNDKIYNSASSYVDAGSGNNYVDLEEDGFSQVYAGSGNDTIFARGGNNTINVGAGNNYLNVGYKFNYTDIGNNVIETGDGTDTIDISGAHNQVNVGDGNKTIYVTGMNNTVTTGDGKNYINTGGNSTITTGDGGGNVYSGANSIINMGDGNNLISTGSNSTITSGDGGGSVYSGANSIITVGDGNDYIQAGDYSILNGGGGLGNDTISINYSVIDGGEGDDSLTGNSSTLYGGEDDDNLTGNNSILYGGEGDDKLQSNSNSSLYGGLGDDSISVFGGANNIIDSGDGDDTISICAESANMVYAGLGDDSIRIGDSPNDMIDSGEGNDFIELECGSRGGNDSIYAGLGDDTISMNDCENNFIYAGAGDDSISIDGSYYNTIDTGDGNDFINFLEWNTDRNTIYAGSGNDTIIMPSGINKIYAGDGNDSIVEQSSCNLIDAGNGDDYIDTYAFSDTIISGAGNDTISVEFNGMDDMKDSTVSDSSGTDTIDFLAYSKSEIAFSKDNNDLLINGGLAIKDWFLSDSNKIENFVFTDGTVSSTELDNLFNTQSDSGDNLITGTDGNDIVVGNDGNDTIIAGAGNDAIAGGSGNDVLDGGSGGDAMYGGSGDDAYYVDNTSDIVGEKENQGFDTVNSSISYKLGNNVEKLVLTGTGNINGIASNNASTIIGNSGNNIIGGEIDEYGNEYASGSVYLDGGAGDDTLIGSWEADTLIGGSGNDSIASTSGNDIVNGGMGNDYLDGGTGDDTYIFNLGDGQDVILDVDPWSPSQSAGNDIIKFGAGVTKDNIKVTVDGNDVLIAYGTSGDSIKVLGQLSGGNTPIDSLLFEDGTSVDINSMIPAVNNNPTATLDSGVVDEDSSVVLDVLANASDIDGDTLSIGSFTQGANGAITLNQDNKLVYTPNANYNGVDSFDYTISDGKGGTVTKTVNVAVNSVNDLPTANLISANLDEDSSVVLDVLANASDVDGDALSIGSFTQGTNGVITLNKDNQLVYTPNANYNGVDSFDYTISDGKGGTVTKTVNVNVNSVNDLPTANLTSANLDEDSSVVLDVLANASDVDGDALSIGSFTQGTNGVITLNKDNQLVYTPNANYNGVDSFDYTISDGKGGTVTKTVNVNVNSVNDLPTANLTSANLDEDSSVVLDVLANASDVDGDALSIGSFTQGTNGAITLNQDNKLVYTPNANYNGVDSFDYTISDGKGGTVTKTVNVNVNSLPVTITGGIGNDTLNGNLKDNTIDGGAGSDTMMGGAGNDTYNVDNTGDVVTENTSEGTDTVNSSIDYALGTNVENLSLTGSNAINGIGNELDNTITGNSANNTLDGGAGSDTLFGGDGNDTYYVDNTGDVVTENTSEGTDIVNSSITYTLGTNVENLTLTGSNAINGAGNELDNTIIGNSANNTLDGGTGLDTMAGGLGDDTYYVDNTGDVVAENTSEGIDTVNSSVSYTIGANVENLTLTGSNAINGIGNELDNTIIGNSANNILDGGAGNDRLDGGTGSDTMIGGVGNDTYYVDNVGDVITENTSEGTDTVNSSIDYTLGTNVENLTLTGSNAINGNGNTLSNAIEGNSANNILDGGVGNDYLRGGAGNDTLYGGAGNGNDTLDGGTGSDTLVGGVGNDTYYVDNVGDVVTENTSEGTDTVNSSVSYTLGTNVENLTLTGSNAINGNGNTLNNVIYGNSANNVLDGGDGNDTIYGGGGNDTMIGGTGNDVFKGGAGNGTYIFNIGDGNDTMTGNISTNDTLKFGEGITKDNIIFETTGNDLSISYKGSTDSIKLVSQLSYNASDKIENFVFADGTSYTSTEVSKLVSFYGTNGNDTIQNWSTGYGKLYGLDGNDYIDGCSNSSIFGGEGNDTIDAPNGYLDGGSGNDSIESYAGNCTIIGGTNDDVLLSPGSNNTYIFNLGDGQDIISYTGPQTTYKFGAGITQDNIIFAKAKNYSSDFNIAYKDSTDFIVIQSGVSQLDTFMFADGTSYTYNDVLSHLVYDWGYTITGSDEADIMTGLNINDKMYGYGGNDRITSFNGNDTIDGGLGNDTMVGGLGDDTYYVDSIGDVITENVNEGTDAVISSVTYTLGNNVENLTLNGNTAINGTGNTLNNLITGNLANNTLDGGLGYDTMVGGLGDDTYYVESSGGMIIENSGEGTDTVISSSTSYSLGANVENLTLTGSATSGSGNNLDNIIIGNSSSNWLYGYDGNDIIDGGLGNDSMYGGLGDDTYYVDSSGDAISENSGEGTDAVISSSSYSLGANVENLTLIGSATSGSGNNLDNIIIGNSLSNSLYGYDGNDTLNGGAGGDNMLGGFGNDTYYVDSSQDRVNESLQQGLDTVCSTITYTLGANVENLTLIGTSAINGTGNSSDNVLTGNSAKNTLTGGSGNDTYYLDNLDSIVEYSGQGVDTVCSTATYTLGANLENLTLIGTSAINATGNSYDNALTGNSANNTLTGGFGNDTYSFTSGGKNDTVNDSSGTDKICFDSSIMKNQIAIFKQGNDLVIDYGTIGGADKITAVNGTTGANIIEKIQLSDGKYMSNTDVNNIIQAMTTYATNNSIQLTSVSDVKNNQDLMAIVATAWHN